VLSCAAPRVTFAELVEAHAPGALPPPFLRHVTTADVSSGSVKINLALGALPNFLCAPTPDGLPGPHHRGTIHFETDMGTIEAAFRDAAAGRPSARPVIERTLPSVLEPSLAPPGRHVALLFVQWAPYARADGVSWSAPAARTELLDSVLRVVEAHAPGFSASVLGVDLLTPPDLEAVFGLPGGNIFHGAMGLDALFTMRPAPGWARYRSPLRGLYLGGAGAHPGGGVMGAPGRNAAAAVLEDWADVAAVSGRSPYREGGMHVQGSTPPHGR
jgi:phytoene dehydrogenase-like protein